MIERGVSLETMAWLRRWVLVVVVALTGITALSAFAENMPDDHHVAVPLAAGVMLAAWLIELSGVRWPRSVFILGVVLPNVWLVVIGHTSANILFLVVMVAWLGAVGTRTESTLALVLSLGTIGVGIVRDAVTGQIFWLSWLSWLTGITLTWLMARVLRRQEFLVEELRLARRESDARRQELESLLTVSRSIASNLEARPLMDAVLDALGAVVDYEGTAILTLDETEQALVFAHMRGPAQFASDDARRMRYAVSDLSPIWGRLCGDQPIIVADVRADTPDARTFRSLIGAPDLEQSPYGFIRSLMWVPLVSRGRLIGLLSVANQRPGAYTQHEAALALAIGQQAAVALENAQLHERARQAATLEERERLARELHDSVTQSLYGASLYAEAAARALGDGDVQSAGSHIQDIQATVREALSEMRLLLFELRPPLLDERGLAGALRSRLDAVEARAGLDVEFQMQVLERVPPETEQELFRIAQEALNNVLKHAHATHVTVRLEQSSTTTNLEVADNGLGFDPALDGHGGFGLAGLRERAQRLGGTVDLQSAPGAGTRVRVEVPR